MSGTFFPTGFRQKTFPSGSHYCSSAGVKIWTLASVMVVLASAFGGSGEARAQEAVKETTQFAAQPPLPTVHLVIKGKSILTKNTKDML